MRDAFSRTRSDHARELAEDYVELIHQLAKASPASAPAGRVRTVDLERALGVSQPTVTKTLRRLEREGLVIVAPREGVSLTPQGDALAAQSRARHTLVVEFLRSLGVAQEQAELDAEGMEHHVSTETLIAMRQHLASQTILR